MRTKVTLVLLFLNVVLFFFLFTFVRKWQTDRIWEESRKRVLGPEVAAIQSLEISGGRLAEAVRIEKRADGWMLTKPIEWPANPHAITRMLNELMFLEHETSFLVKDLPKSGLSLSDYGLDKPKLTLTFTAGMSGAGAAAPLKTVVLRVGDTTKVGNRLYVLSPDGERIHVVGRSLADSLALTLEQLRADTIFNIPLFEVRSFNLQTAAPANLRIRLRREGPLWSFEAPILTRANRTEVELAINGLNALRTRSFIDPAAVPSDQTGLANPALRLTLEGNGRRETLLLGNAVAAAGADTKPPADGSAAAEAPPEPATELYAKMEDRAPVFTVAFPDRLFDDLRNAQEKLRDKHLLSFDPRALTSITLVAPSRPELTLQRLETGRQPLDTDPWQIVTRAANQAPQTLPADLPRVQRVIQQLYLLQAQKFLRDAPQAVELENWGFNRPEREITLNFAIKGGLPPGGLPSSTAPTSVTLLLGIASERENRAYAKLANEPFVYLVDPEILRETPVTVNYYRDRLLRELPAGASITGLALTDTTSKTELFSRQLAANETWDQALATEPEPRRTALLALLEQLRSLRAKSFVLESFPPSVEIAGEARAWKYKLEATVALVGGTGTQTAPYTLFFTERTGGGTQLAGSPERNVVFEADQKLLDALFTLTFGSHDPGPASPPVPGSPSAGAPD
ncbi:MAG TPA: DUF4340 domain-containing protein [Opitutaceae bacterium]|nr:DUF4340 domain-containing protein [Opitutaceae bacterium]